VQIVTVRRVLPAVAMVAAVAFGTAACGGGGDVDKSALVAKLKTESDFKTLTDNQASCIADVVIKYVNKDDVNKYVKGDAKELADPPKDKEGEATKAITDCATK
jgi:hypothetical protein